ncbi:hypothetical protein HDF17_001575 [Granulicella arctica]|uniref:Uncharacterized protein n=1 Tax=Granulicella arctica TaxID=940613 RepID=A0A7Y9TSS5_9BACT|nr:hypothetical protein [Granulicella arctica]
MAIPQRTATEGTFFITTISYNRRRLFQLPRRGTLPRNDSNCIHQRHVPRMWCLLTNFTPKTTHLSKRNYKNVTTKP